MTDVVGPLADHQVAASLKEKVVKEASVAATTTSGGKVPTKARKFSSVLGHCRKAATPSVISSCRQIVQQGGFLLTLY